MIHAKLLSRDGSFSRYASDRCISAAFGGRARGHEDGFSVNGVPTRPRGGKVESRDDHRIAMLGAVAGVWSREGVRVEGAESVAISFPGFYELLDRLAQR